MRQRWWGQCLALARWTRAPLASSIPRSPGGCAPRDGTPPVDRVVAPAVGRPRGPPARLPPPAATAGVERRPRGPGLAGGTLRGDPAQHRPDRPPGSHRGGLGEPAAAATGCVMRPGGHAAAGAARGVAGVGLEPSGRCVPDRLARPAGRPHRPGVLVRAPGLCARRRRRDRPPGSPAAHGADRGGDAYPDFADLLAQLQAARQALAQGRRRAAPPQ